MLAWLNCVSAGKGAKRCWSGTKLAAKNDSWQNWTQEWETVSADFTKVSVEVGSDETELNFAWLTKKVPNPTPVVYFGKNKNKLVKYSGSFSAVNKNLIGDEEYLSNKVTVSELAKNTNYFYCVEKNGARSEIKTIRTGDYFYKYGSTLFIVLNTNNYNVAEHELTMREAVDYAPDAKWRIVTIHQDIYGSGLDHSDTDGMILRTQQDYIAVLSQNWLPSYSIIKITPEKFAIDTYQITDDGKVEKIDESFTIVKK